MIKLQVSIAALGSLCLILLLALLFKGCGKNTTSLIPPAVQHEIDSLKTTQVVFQQQAESLRTVVKHDTLIAFKYRARVDTLRRVDTVLHHVADSIAVIAARTDSSSTWRAAYVARTQEVDTLRRALAASDTAFVHERAARIALGIAYAADTNRRVAIEHVNASLVKTISGLQHPCRLLGFIPCPSRTVSFVAGGVLGVAGTIVVRR